jgi:predicted ATPase
VPERHRSLRAAFDYAWRLLSPSEQAALARVSVFRGSFSLQAAVAVTDTTVADLAGLLDRSLLSRTGQGRYRVHPLLRQFAADLLRELGLSEALENRHMAAFAALVRKQAPLLRASQPGPASGPSRDGGGPGERGGCLAPCDRPASR